MVTNTESIRRVLSGGRITLDEKIRKHLKLNDGDYIILKQADSDGEARISIRKAKVT